MRNCIVKGIEKLRKIWYNDVYFIREVAMGFWSKLFKKKQEDITSSNFPEYQQVKIQEF